jgi:AcrR family transcriptional regulator
MISTEAGVSARTFFNYFQSKEEAILTPPPELLPDMRDRFTAAGPAHPQAVLRDLISVLVENLAALVSDSSDLRDSFALAEHEPKLATLLLAQFAQFRRSLASAVAERLGKRRGDEASELIAELALVAVRTGMERWVRTGARGSPVRHLRRSAALLSDLMAQENQR